MELKIEHLTAIVDSREQLPWDLSPMKTETAGLSVGDYSIKGLESVVAIERKSLADLVACCGGERDRFQKELDRLRGWPVNAIVIEANWADLEKGQWRSKLSAKQVQASFCSWVAQGHRMILGRDHATAASIARAILFYAARYRIREAAGIMANMPG